MPIGSWLLSDRPDDVGYQLERGLCAILRAENFGPPVDAERCAGLAFGDAALANWACRRLPDTRPTEMCGSVRRACR